MSPSNLSAIPNRPYRVSSRAALTSPSLPLGPNGNASTNRVPPLPHDQYPLRTMASQRSIDAPRHDFTSRTQHLPVQASLAQTDHPTAGPQLPQLLSTKPTASGGVYKKLKNVKSFFRRQAAQSDDDCDSYDTGRGADPSTNSEPGYRSSSSHRPRVARPSPTTDTASLDSVRAAPSLAPSESFVRPRASSSKSRPLGIRNDLIKQFHHDPHYLEFASNPPPLPPTPPSSSTCSSHEDFTPTRSNHGPIMAQKSFDLAVDALPPGSKQVTPKPSFSAPRVTTVSEAYARRAALQHLNAEQSKNASDNARSECDALTKGRRSPSSYSVASSANQSEKDGETSVFGDDTNADIGRSMYDRSIDDLTTESFEINVAQELKPTTACKLVLSEPGHSLLAVRTGASSAGSSVRSSLSGFTNSGSNRDEYTSPCSTNSSLPSPQLPLDEEYINIHQIRQVLKGLQSLLEKIDPQARDARDPLNGTPSDHRPPSSSTCNPNFRINHVEFLRMIKAELDR
ncbi:hypothetical protein PTTG_00133 [Puccinia triticina 1-1 BBBD Race 1]|uniref:Uncharacterized protein n=2 Tax=Puccinia triticina TaxID=208348 RepID=A0A180GX46_PUCT1|nr:uncharacterized protein PtA15_9A661 [Puccinia triticina]OAV97396.1 hypothetical protein PTTG_00133 [Puccinia triticina 1-1 BBBD Race 1]WAQ88534.1 hypothetical protein PtA15_9A661 [Puccinia triticina]WAR60713.1 hypothetical protein PtB15_9B652 [Puccinia triticina]